MATKEGSGEAETCEHGYPSGGLCPLCRGIKVMNELLANPEWRPHILRGCTRSMCACGCCRIDPTGSFYTPATDVEYGATPPTGDPASTPGETGGGR